MLHDLFILFIHVFSTLLTIRHVAAAATTLVVAVVLSAGLLLLVVPACLPALPKTCACIMLL